MDAVKNVGDWGLSNNSPHTNPENGMNKYRHVMKKLAELLDSGYCFHETVETRWFDCSVSVWKIDVGNSRWDRPHQYIVIFDGEEWPFMHGVDAARTYIKLVGRNAAWRQIEKIMEVRDERNG